MALIDNPILPGFHPDPCILRVGSDYYIATSTFEWFPGVRIYHSRDLAHWEVLGHALTRATQLNLAGVPDSGGVWAPGLSHDGRQFYLAFTVVQERTWPLVVSANYVVTAERAEGPWSEPVFLHASGWDPSIFHDEDGRKWLLSTILDHRPGHEAMAGITMQEYSAAEQRLIGPNRVVFAPVGVGGVEGPHLVRRGEYYYLITASGGTSWDHAVTVARSRELHGIYEMDPKGPMLTSRHDPENPLQKAGHGNLVETPSGELFLAHLCARPVTQLRRCPLGRETALQKVQFEQGWPRLASGGNTPLLQVEAPEPLVRSPGESAAVEVARIEPGYLQLQAPLAAGPQARSWRDDFDGKELDMHWCTLRAPADESWLSLRQQPGRMTLRGRDGFVSKHEQSLVARRLQAFSVRIETCVEFHPESFQEMAGLVCIYDTRDVLCARVTHDEAHGRVVDVAWLDGGKYREPVDQPKPLTESSVYLSLEIRDFKMQFSYSENGKQWSPLGPSFDFTQFSDEYGDKGGFTGAMVGLCAQDLRARQKTAHFDYFSYEELGA